MIRRRFKWWDCGQTALGLVHQVEGYHSPPAPYSGNLNDTCRWLAVPTWRSVWKSIARNAERAIGL